MRHRRMIAFFLVALSIGYVFFPFLPPVPIVQASSTAILTKRPNGDSIIQLSRSTWSYDYMCVNESSANDTDYVELGNTATQRDLYTLDGGTIPNGTVVNSVTAFFRAKYVQITSTATVQAAGTIKVGGTEYTSALQTLTTSWVTLNSSGVATWNATSPYTGLAWTSYEIENLLAGPTLKSTNINNRLPECSWFYIEVNYTIPDAATVAPAIQDFYINSTWANQPTLFSFNVSDSVALNNATFYNNVTGTNSTFGLAGYVAWVNTTVTMPVSAGTVAFQLWVTNNNASLSNTTGLRYMKVYLYNSTAGAWNTPYNSLGDLLEAVEGANSWGNVETYASVVLDQSPVSALSTMIDQSGAIPDSETFSYCNNYVSGSWSNPTYAYDNNTGTGASIAWSASGYSAYLTLNFTGTTKGSKIRFWVGRSSTQITNMQVAVANQTGSWVTVINQVPTYGSYQNLTIVLSQYTALRFRFSKTGTTSRTAYVYEVQGINDSVSYSGNWPAVLQWSAFCNKLGITRQTAIINALNNFSMINSSDLTASLPYTSWTGVYPYYAFNVQYAWALYGYYYANQSWAIGNVNATKWNITSAFQFFNTTIYNASRYVSGAPFLFIYNGSTAGQPAYPRYYDEAASLIRDYILWERLLNVSGAMNDALYWWNWTLDHLWSIPGQHFNYAYNPDEYNETTDYLYETEAAFFLKVISELKYYNPSLANWTNVLTDIGKRFLSYKWNSYQWMDGETNITTYSVVHSYSPNSTAWTSNEQRRLENTLGTWQALLGVYSRLNSTYQSNVQDMLYGNSATEPAWALLLRPHNTSLAPAEVGTGPGLFDNTTKMFSLSSNDPGYSFVDNENATAYAEILLFLLGIVPQNTTIAFPLEELNYEYLQDIDPSLLQLKMNLTAQAVTVSVSAAGALTFQYGVSPVTYNFNQSGVWQISFSPSWNMINSVTLVNGTLPTNVIYFATIYASPLYSNLGSNSTVASSVCLFYSYWTDVVEGMTLEGFIFGTNNTGTFTNESWTNTGWGGTTAWANVTKTLNSTNGMVIQWQVWANDTHGSWNNTGLQSFTLSVNMTVALGSTLSIIANSQKSSGNAFSRNNQLSMLPLSGLGRGLGFQLPSSFTLSSALSYGRELSFLNSLSLLLSSAAVFLKGVSFGSKDAVSLLHVSGMGKESGFVSSNLLSLVPSSSKGMEVSFAPQSSIALNSLFSLLNAVNFAPSNMVTLSPSSLLSRALGFTSNNAFSFSSAVLNPKELAFSLPASFAVSDMLVSGRALSFFNILSLLGIDTIRQSKGLGYSPSQTVSVTGPLARYENVSSGDDSYLAVYGNNWYAQSVTVSSVHDVDLVKLKLFRTGSPGMFVVGIRAVDESGSPTGEDLTNGTINGNGFSIDTNGEWISISVSSYSLNVDSYAILVHATSGDITDYVGWRCVAAGSYGSVKTSGDGGASWTSYTP